jgi:hypothetical protein
MQTMTIAAATGVFIGGAGVLAFAVPASAATTPVTAVTLPAAAQAGIHSATITHSVSWA